MWVLLTGVCAAVYISVNTCVHVAGMRHTVRYKRAPAHGCMDMQLMLTAAELL